MRMKLFDVGILKDEQTTWTCVVAPSEERALEFIREHHERTGRDYEATQISRIDHLLTDKVIGLGDMLESAPVAFASDSHPVGWIAHAAAVDRLRLFRVEARGGEESFVVAPSADVAATVWLEASGPTDCNFQMFRIHDALLTVPEDQRAGLDGLLEFGPVGIVAWHAATGWWHA